jgi:hypothetical protein
MWFISLSNHIGRSARDGAVFSTLARWFENRISPGGSKISLQPGQAAFYLWQSACQNSGRYQFIHNILFFKALSKFSKLLLDIFGPLFKLIMLS